MSLDKLHYTNGGVTVTWQPKLCTHSGNCVRGLNAVFNNREWPWIKMEGANSQTIIEQVKKCLSVALSIVMNAGLQGNNK